MCISVTSHIPGYPCAVWEDRMLLTGGRLSHEFVRGGVDLGDGHHVGGRDL